MCCIKPLGNCITWSLLSRNFSPNVIFRWFRGYLGDLLWVRVIITTIIYHRTVTAQVPVNRRLGMIERRINHTPLPGAFAWWIKAKAAMDADITAICKVSQHMKCPEMLMALLLPLRPLTKSWTSLSLSLWFLGISSCLFCVCLFFFFVCVFYLALRCLNERHNENLNSGCYQIWLTLEDDRAI